MVFFTEHPGTKFTREPPPTVFGNLGSDVTLHWKFEFGNNQDWDKFEEIFWGETDNNDRIRNKFITVSKDKKKTYNSKIPSSLQSRLGVTGNISRQGSNLMFVLRNMTRSDALITFGCTAIVYGDDFRSGPIKLAIQGKDPSSAYCTKGLV